MLKLTLSMLSWSTSPKLLIYKNDFPLLEKNSLSNEHTRAVRCRPGKNRGAEATPLLSSVTGGQLGPLRPSHGIWIIAVNSQGDFTQTPEWKHSLIPLVIYVISITILLKRGRHKHLAPVTPETKINLYIKCKENRKTNQKAPLKFQLCPWKSVTCTLLILSRIRFLSWSRDINSGTDVWRFFFGGRG